MSNTASTTGPGCGDQSTATAAGGLGTQGPRWALGAELYGPDGRERIVLLEPRHVLTCQNCGCEIALVRDTAAAALVAASTCRGCVPGSRHGR